MRYKDHIQRDHIKGKLRLQKCRIEAELALHGYYGRGVNSFKRFNIWEDVQSKIN